MRRAARILLRVLSWLLLFAALALLAAWLAWRASVPEVEGERPYLAMRLIEGETLAAHIAHAPHHRNAHGPRHDHHMRGG